MPRKAYIADLDAVIHSDKIPEGVSDVRRGDDDGFIDFNFVAPSGESFPVTAVVSDVSDYPSSHKYILSGDSTSPPDLTQALTCAEACLQPGLTIRGLLEHVSHFFYAEDSASDNDDSEATDDDEVYGSDHDPRFFDYGDADALSGHFESTSFSVSIPSIQERNMIRGDLRKAKKAGFRVAAFPSILQGKPTYVSVSCKVKHLGISEEAMQAWGIAAQDYLILLLQYPQGYKGLEGRKASLVPSKDSIEFRTGIGPSYKPTATEMCNAFSQSKPKAVVDEGIAGFRDHFISESMKHLLEEKFLMLLKSRLSGMTWDGALLFYHDLQRSDATDLVASKDSKYCCENAPSGAFPELVTADHVNDRDSKSRPSLPLIAMQFFVRNFVRSPDYCLNCHRRMPDGLEALKPYVCDNPLCLFHYMQMGFGPRIEHEIMTQPRVVDLLVTLCYCSARTQSLDSNLLPKGLGLKIPPLDVLRFGRFLGTAKPNDITLNLRADQNHGSGPTIDSMKVRVNMDHRDMTFTGDISQTELGIKRGDWVAFKLRSWSEILHAKIEDAACYPMVRFSTPIVMPLTVLQSSVMDVENPDQTPCVELPSGSQDASAWLYTTEIDRFDKHQMRDAIYLLLEMLPSVEEMQHYLKQSGSDLKSWSDRIPQPVLGLLRWIIASNRACIMQIDLPDGPDSRADVGQQAVFGMPKWMQFKFAMGAPDKERRFLQSVDSIQKEMKLKIPTLFAWHGSSLQNWHSIIRDGLNYSRIVNGRAYGNGIYFARQAVTSIAYSSRGGEGSSGSWPLSKVRPSTVLSLSEVVNAPSKFTSQNPYYVVQHLDWTQTRYLFVQQADKNELRSGQVKDVPVPVFPHPQDPGVTPQGSSGMQLIIPASKKMRNASRSVSIGNKRLKVHGSASDPISIDDDSSSSVATDDEDSKLLELERDPIQEAANNPLTDFVPGTLDRSKLPTMAPPTGNAASGGASRRLQSDLRLICEVQDSTPLHELGWYIDTGFIIENGNFYQWIVELHSFDPSIPLAQDMKARGIKSIVLEIRFAQNYPWSPPFVRVVRPRFLSFMEGGGGHVTAGGALCMELLTNSGWTGASTIESVLMQVRMAMSSTDPRPARLDNRRRTEYGVGEAVEAYKRACRTHGWKVPEGLDAMMAG